MTATPTAKSGPSDFRRIAHLIGSIFFAGNFKAETPNERELESLLVKVGTRYQSWDEIVQGEDALTATPPAEVMDAIDAERFRFLRDSGLEISWNSQVSFSPGYSGDAHLMELAIDNAIASIATPPPADARDAVPAAYERGGALMRTIMEAEKTQFYGDGPIFPLYRHPPIAPPIAQQGGVEVTDEIMTLAACDAYDEAARLDGETCKELAQYPWMHAAIKAALASKADGGSILPDLHDAYRQATQPAATGAGEPLESQVDRLANFIIQNIPGEPSQSQGAIDTAIRLLNPVAAMSDALSGQEAMLAWAVNQWHDQVANRPLVNVHRRSLDDVWRQVIRHCGADDVVLIGPRHDQLLAESQESKS